MKRDPAPHGPLDSRRFLGAVDAVPLVSLDLVTRNPAGEVLLGMRANRPARGHWFVPGGRVYKNEPLQATLERVCMKELGLPAPPVRLLGVHEHFYDDNFFAAPRIGTHYVVIALECLLPVPTRPVADAQHTELRWWKVADLLASGEVHENTKRYFRESGGVFAVP